MTDPVIPVPIGVVPPKDDPKTPSVPKTSPTPPESPNKPPGQHMQLLVAGNQAGGVRGSSAGRESNRRQSYSSNYEDGGRTSTMRGSQRGPPPSKAPIARLRAKVLQSKWYHSPMIVQLRTLLHGKGFATWMMSCLFLALFLPDLWILSETNSNFAIDLILTVVMLSFFVELVMLSVCDASYFLSFFMLMDCLGTVTMVWDISYLAGNDATKPVYQGSSGHPAQLMLLRATRAAKVGARAGRLSRVLRFLRFLPFLTSGQPDKEGKAGIASMISGQLANLLATRVACLTILLVMLIPLFDTWTHPVADHSLKTWADRLSEDHTNSWTDDLNVDTQAMVDFFDRYEYGPYKVCTGQPNSAEKTFTCNATLPMNAKLGEPRRGASRAMIHTNHLMVCFNMHQPAQKSAGISISIIFFIILIMVFSGLALSSAVTALAVRPLERMLGTVREIASTVFKFSAEAGAENEEEPTDIDSSSEMKLLEKVVQKLAIIADLQTKNDPKATDDMEEEDIGILSMMHGKNIVEEEQKQMRRTCAVPRKKALVPVLRLEDFGVSQETWQSWEFNALPMTKQQRCSLAVWTISRFFESGEGFIHSPEEEQTLQRFVSACEKEYLPVPFHNFAHSLDVLHGTSRILRLISSEAYLTDLEQFTLLVSAVAHDVGHPGVNNGFLSEVGHELALQYNDKSPLENMHCAKLYTIVGNPATNIFANLSKEQYREARVACIETILHTDMMGHNAMVKDLQMTYQMNYEIFGAAEQGAQPAMGIPGAPPGAPNFAEVEVFSQAETKMLVMNCILHSADVSNPCKAWETTQAWAVVCLEEFFMQGDQEKMLGVPVQFLNDRDKLNRPNSQIGFIEFMIAPLFAAVVRLWPPLSDLGDNLGNNLGYWEELWVKETKPIPEEAEKVRTRVGKVQHNLAEAKLRTPPISGPK